MMEAMAIVKTEHGRRYLGQFCKHFAHKLPVELAETNDRGEVVFGVGLCALAADEEALTLRVTASTAEAMITLQDVAGRHLVRFGFRETLVVEWKDGVAAA